MGATISFLLIGTIVALFICFLWISCICDESKSTFVNRSQYDYYYDTETMRFVSPNDRKMATTTLIAQMKPKGINISPQQAATISDAIIITLLDTAEEEEKAFLTAKLVMMLDPTYKTGLKYTFAARVNNKQFQNDAERQIVYELCLKYFVAASIPMSVPLSEIDDAALLRMFSTLQPPLKK